MPNKRSYDQLGRPLKEHMYERTIPKAVAYDPSKPPLITDWCVQQKAAVLKAAPFVVGVTTFKVPAEMTRYKPGKLALRLGTVIECMDGGDATPLQVAKLKELDDILLIYDDIEPSSLQLRPHSSFLFKICKGALVGALGRRLGHISVTFGSLSLDYPKLECKELYSLDNDHERDRGGPAINCHGEVIGIMVGGSYFLPCNLVSRWWKFYKKHRKFCRPYLGVKVANLHAADEKFLEPFLHKFPTFLSGVIVTEVAQNSVAYDSGLCSEDVIVQCDAALVRSTLEFFARLWDKAGETVELTVLRASSSECINLIMTVGEATEDNYYQWPVPEWCRRPVSKSKLLQFKGLSKFEELFQRPPDDPGKMT